MVGIMVGFVEHVVDEDEQVDVEGAGCAHASLNIEATVSLTCSAHVMDEQLEEKDAPMGQAQKPTYL